jgi:hypothetical protein
MYSNFSYITNFWGNTQHTNVIFKMLKRIIRIMVGLRNRDSCREHFKMLKILPLQSQYLLTLLLFVADNEDYFRLNSEIHSFNTKNKSNLHLPLSKLCSRGDLIILELGPSITCRPMWNTYSRLRNNLNEPWKNSYIFIHFIA